MNDVKEIKLDITGHKELVKILEQNAKMDQLRSELYLRDIESSIRSRKEQKVHNTKVRKLFEYETIINAMQMVAVASIALSLLM